MSLPRFFLGHRVLVTLAVLGLLGSTAAACTGERPVPAGPYQLVSFDSCADVLTGLRTAAKAVVGPYGLYGGFAVPAARSGPLSSTSSPTR